MALTLGSRLGVYHITAPIGEGGMGQVYRARDTKLNRDVALKVLPDSFAHDPDRLARFTREAQTLASLNHPNIAHIHGLEESGNVRALVMELVEGEDLSQRIARGALPLDEALPIAKQIAEALEAAHEQGIIHRDLKPANIKVRPDGTVKILDFGLAKATEAGAASSPSLSLPTITTPAMTQIGMIVGTAAYMSPEQARGKTIDKRADIWAFGCVVHEMLTGTRLFHGESVPDTLGLILSREPDLSTLPSATPPQIRTLVARCLVREPRQRLRDIGEARVALGDAPDTPSGALQSPTTPALWRWVPWSLAAAATLTAGWALSSRSGSITTQGATTHLEIGYPRDVESYPGATMPPAISPDGRTVAMIGVRDGLRRIFVRQLDRADAVELAVTAGANGAVFSPDGGSVAVLFTSGLITRIALTDQQRKVVTTGALTLAWTRAGIVFSRGGGLWVISPDGGEPRALTELDAARREVAHDNAVVLPGERRVLFVSRTADAGDERIESVSIDGGRRSVVFERAGSPVWSHTGHLLFVRNGAVLAVALDPATATPTGTAVPIVPAGAIERTAFGQIAYTLSSNGTLLFTPAGFSDSRVVAVDRDGAARAFDLPSARYSNPRISPDGRRLLVESGQSIDVLDLARGTTARLASTMLSSTFSAWSADGRRIVFRGGGVPTWVATDGSGVAGSVPGATMTDFLAPGPDADSFVTLRVRPDTSGDIFLMSISGAFEPKPLIVSPAYEGGPQLSRDGRWLLYQSDASGRPEIYVRRYPELDRPWQVSDGGGIQPRWSRSNREIYYRGGRHIVAVTFDASGSEPAFGKPVPLFRDDYDVGSGASIANYDVTDDGRFIMIRRGANGGRLRVVVNWTDELKQILASGGLR